MTLTACDQPDAAPAAQPVAVTSDSFIAATAEIDEHRLAALADAFDADPLGVVDRLERDAGGRSALRRYIAAMLDQDEVARLGRQSAMVLSDAGGGTRKKAVASAAFTVVLCLFVWIGFAMLLGVPTPEGMLF